MSEAQAAQTQTHTQAQTLAQVRNHVGYFTLNRPAALNVLSLQMVRDMHAQLRQWAGDPQVRLVVVRGAAGKAFCAGGDIRALYDAHLSQTPGYMQFFVEEYDLDHYIYRYPKPYVALMDGYVMGGGMGISQGAALRIITERTRMAMPEVGIGFFPDAGGSYFLSRLQGVMGNYFGLTGVHIRAADAVYGGLADFVLSSDRLAALDGLLDAMQWSDSPLEQLKDSLKSLQTDDAAADAPLANLREAIELHFSLPTVAAIKASLAAEARPAFAAWAQESLNSMERASPLAMSVTLEELRRARKLSMADCFRMENTMVRAWFRRGDFIEGVRALIVDKDNQPNWNPVKLDAVTPEQVSSYFEPMHEQTATPGDGDVQ